MPIHRQGVMYAMVVLFLSCTLSFGQFQNGNQTQVLELPLLSQNAHVSQRIGLTDINISYHRPLANGRKIFGTVVPYGRVWRAGANENTTIEFTDPVTIEGKALDKGVYGLHMIPNEDHWTIIFSKNSTSWGSFTYDQKEDALRVDVKPQAAEAHDALSYDFDNLKADSAVITMRWDRVAVPFQIGVNVKDTTLVSLHNQLRGLVQFDWRGWNDGATYLLDNKIDLDEALQWSDRSIQNEERFDNLMTKARALTALNRNQEAVTVRDKALNLATVLQMHFYGRQLQAENKQSEAFAVYRENAKKHPTEWVVHTGMARVYSGEGDFKKAADEMKIAAASAPNDLQKSYLEGLLKRLEEKQDINK
jgi:DUF2911 family protein